VHNVLSGTIIAGAIVIGLAANGLPSMSYALQHGRNHEVAERRSWEAEVYGLSLSQLLLPVTGHRVPLLRQLKERYMAATEPLNGADGVTSLGLVGDVGFLLLLGMAMSQRDAEPSRVGLLRSLGVLVFLAVLLAMIGGFGSLIALLITPQIRGYSRINVLIAFMSLFAVVILLENLLRAHPRLGKALVPAVLILGLYDQASVLAVRPYAETKVTFASDAELVRRIESRVSAGTAVFELPYVSFPEGAAVESLGGYDAARPYLHSHALRWSFPAMRGRVGDLWLRDVSARPPGRILETVAAIGFGGILIQRDGYSDDGSAIESALRTTLGDEPLVSSNGRLAFFDLSEYRRLLPAQGRPAWALCHEGTCDCGVLRSKEKLAGGQSVASCDGRYTLTMQADGDLVLHGAGCGKEDGRCWSSGSAGHPGAYALMQGDGNLVLFAAGCTGPYSSCWDSHSFGHDGAALAVQNDGRACVFGGGCSGHESLCWCSR
jgi:phosphoglycerol transferase